MDSNVSCLIGINSIRLLMRILPSEVNNVRTGSSPSFIVISAASIPCEKTRPASFQAFRTPTSYPDGNGAFHELSWMVLNPITDFWMMSIPESNPAIDSCWVLLSKPNTAMGLPCPNDTRSRSISDLTELGTLPWRRLFGWPSNTFATRSIAVCMPLRKPKSSASGIVPGPTAEPRKRISNNGLVTVTGRTSHSTRRVRPVPPTAVATGVRCGPALAPRECDWRGVALPASEIVLCGAHGNLLWSASPSLLLRAAVPSLSPGIERLHTERQVGVPSLPCACAA